MTSFTKSKIEELLKLHDGVVKVYLNGDLTDLREEPTFLVVIDNTCDGITRGNIQADWMHFLHQICYNKEWDTSNVWVSVCREHEISVCMSNECLDIDETNLVYDSGSWCVDITD